MSDFPCQSIGVKIRVGLGYDVSGANVVYFVVKSVASSIQPAIRNQFTATVGTEPLTQTINGVSTTYPAGQWAYYITQALTDIPQPGMWSGQMQPEWTSGSPPPNIPSTEFQMDVGIRL